MHTYQKPHRSWPLRLLHGLGSVLPLDRVPFLHLDADALVAKAEQQTGLRHWGDRRFRDPFDRLVESLRTEAHLHPTGRYYFHQYLLRLLTNRLQLQACWQAHPEILQVPLVRPLFVVGMYRSGTTFLHNLLAEDPQSQWLPVWQGLYPCAEPDGADPTGDRRIQKALEHLAFQNSLAPNFSTAHHIDAQRPAECSRLFEHSFVGHLFDFRVGVPTYSQWLLDQDLRSAYQEYRQQLQLLSWAKVGAEHQPHWVLKAPAHIFALDSLLETFPDAAIVYLHRDPIEVLPSCCSLATLGRSRFTDHPQPLDPPAIGRHWLEVLSEGIRRADGVCQQVQDAGGQGVYHLQYRDLLRDPLGQIRQIYDYFGYAMGDAFEAKIHGWIQANPQHKRGVHRYSLEQFGLDPQQVNAAFKGTQGG